MKTGGLVDATAGRLVAVAGGRARARVIAILAAVLALSGADLATVGAVAAQLRSDLGIDDTQVGMLASATLGVGAVATLPVGVLTDRARRTRLLTVSVALWGVAMTASALAPDYATLLISRLALGAVTATAGPVVASLVGDFFAAAERGRVYGLILAGDLVGLAFGFVVPGDLAGVAGWRAAFLVLAPPAALLALAIHRWLPEPARGGQSRLRAGAKRIRSVDEIEERAGGERVPAASEPSTGSESLVAKAVRRRDDIDPDRSLILRRNPEKLSLLQAAWYVLRIRTNLALIVASGLGYFYLSGLRTFALVYLRDRYGMSQSAATSLVLVLGMGALAGVLSTGRLSDRLIRLGRLDARIIVAVGCFFFAAATLLPAALMPTVLAALPLFLFASAGLAGVNPPMDAARLDVLHPRLWGRGEALRTLVRSSCEAAAPVLFGVFGDRLAGRTLHIAGVTLGGGPGGGMQLTFLVMLASVLGAGILLWFGVRTYPSDVATAAESELRGRRRQTRRRAASARA